MVQHCQLLREALLRHVNPEQHGLEIAPYFEPSLTKPDYRILYTDYISTEEIRQKASENPSVDFETLVDVDFVWPPGTPLRNHAPEGLDFEYVIASHVMEHVPNPIGWLGELLSVLRPGGKVILYLPQRRFTWDCMRTETTFAQLADYWLHQPGVPTPGQLLDFMTHSLAITHDGPSPSWNTSGQAVNLPRAYSDEGAIDCATYVMQNGNYLDAHCTVWSGASFRNAIERFVELGILNVSIDEVIEEESEFFAVLSKRGEAAVSAPAPGLHASLREIPSARPEPLADWQANNQLMLQSAVHQLGVLRHDLGFLIDLVAARASEPPKRSWFDRLKDGFGASSHSKAMK